MYANFMAKHDIINDVTHYDNGIKLLRRGMSSALYDNTMKPLHKYYILSILLLIVLLFSGHKELMVASRGRPTRSEQLCPLFFI